MESRRRNDNGVGVEGFTRLSLDVPFLRRGIPIHRARRRVVANTIFR